MISVEEQNMPNDPADLLRQLDELKAENKRLREFNDLLRAQRKELMDEVCGPADKYLLSDEELAAALKDPNRTSLSKFLADLGITRKDGSNSQ
jgi:hypothetical protein